MMHGQKNIKLFISTLLFLFWLLWHCFLCLEFGYLFILLLNKCYFMFSFNLVLLLATRSLNENADKQELK